MEMRTLVETISRMTTSDEMRGGPWFRMECEDAIETMDRLIVEARACVAAESAAPRWPMPDLPPPKPGDFVFVIVIHSDMTASQDHLSTPPKHAAACAALLFSLLLKLTGDDGKRPPPALLKALGVLVALAAVKPETMQ